MKKIICLLCATLMIATFFAGCGEKTDTAETKTTVTMIETETTVTETEPTMAMIETTETETTVITTAPPPPEEEWRDEADKYNIPIRNYWEFKWLEDGNTP